MGRNRAILIHSGYKGKVPADYTRLPENWFTHYTSIFINSGLQPESFNEIKTFGILEKAYPLRDHLKKMDYLLSPSGLITINYYTAGNLYIGGQFTRPLSFLMHEISLSYGKRYKLIKKKTEGAITELVYEKQTQPLHENDAMTKWSFGIVSDGRKDDRIKSIIEQIRSFRIPEYEVIICGPAPKFECGQDTKVLSDADLYFDIRIPITAKKNRIINNAAYNNLVLLHDRISFPADWYEKMKKYGNYFEILTNRILDEDTHTMRVQDWMANQTDFNDYTDRHTGYLPYEQWNPSIYVDGGFIIAKRDLLKSVHGYNEALHWGEAEDVDLSNRLYYAGYMTNMYRDNMVFTQTHRHGGINEEKFFKKSSKVKQDLVEIKYQYQLKKQRDEFLRFVNDFSLDFQDGTK